MEVFSFSPQPSVILHSGAWQRLQSLNIPLGVLSGTPNTTGLYYTELQMSRRLPPSDGIGVPFAPLPLNTCDIDCVNQKGVQKYILYVLLILLYIIIYNIYYV